MLNPITRKDTPVSQQFGLNPDYYQSVSGTPGHNGLDLSCVTGTQLYAPVDGQVLEIGTDPSGWGLYCKIGLENGEHFLLAHLSSVQGTVEGDYVVAGTPVCLSGHSGNVRSAFPGGDPSHVHVGWRPWGSYRSTVYHGWADPEPRLALLAQDQGLA